MKKYVCPASRLTEFASAVILSGNMSGGGLNGIAPENQTIPEVDIR